MHEIGRFRTGKLTLRLQNLVGEEGLVLGVDASESTLETPEENGVKNLFYCDIHNFVIPDKFKDLPGTFDAVFTNSTLHWRKQDPHGPVRAAKSLLKPGGRFVGEFPGYMTGADFLRALYRIAFLKDMSDEEAEEVLQEISDICEFDQKNGLGVWSS
ncbi:hypothetical protein FRC11_000715, partial [Ceratobasidium sp. 423]